MVFILNTQFPLSFKSDAIQAIHTSRQKQITGVFELMTPYPSMRWINKYSNAKVKMANQRPTTYTVKSDVIQEMLRGQRAVSCFWPDTGALITNVSACSSKCAEWKWRASSTTVRLCPPCSHCPRYWQLQVLPQYSHIPKFCLHQTIYLAKYVHQKIVSVAVTTFAFLTKVRSILLTNC